MSVKIHTIAAANPGDKVPKLLFVLYDSCDGVAFPLEGEGINTDIAVRKPFHEV